MSSSLSRCAFSRRRPLPRGRRAAARPVSEAGLIRERIRIEALWLLHLAESRAAMLAAAQLPAAVRAARRGAGAEPAPTRPAAVKAIEARINHDVKAVEYYVREQLSRGRRRRGARSSWCTSAAPPKTSTT